MSILTLTAAAFAQDWRATIDTEPPGTFPAPRAFRATYRFGWSGFTAATANVRFARTADRAELSGNVQTIDAVKMLWPFEADHTSSVNAGTLRPIEVKQTESVRSKKITTTLAFDDRGVTATRSESNKPNPKVKRVEMPNLFDLQSGMLYLRSQPLRDGTVHRLVVFPGKDPYLATITVKGRERLAIALGGYNAIKCDLNLSKVTRDNQLKPHKKFKRATVWISDDADRIFLRAEAEVFVGTVFAELQSIEYDQPPVRR